MTKQATTKTKNKQSISTQKRPEKKTKTTKVKKENTKNTSSKTVLVPKKVNAKLTKFLMFLFGLLLVFSTYAWFSTNLNVKIKTFNMVISKNSDLTISFDGINFARNIELSKEIILDQLAETYPNNLSQWAENGLIPVSSPGIVDNNSPIFPMYETGGVLYQIKQKDKGFLRTSLSRQDKPREFNSYLAFDIFLKNDTGSPASDNLYIDSQTAIALVGDYNEEMRGLLNSFRIGIVKIGSVALDASVDEIQNISCNNSCESIIYEPNDKEHTALSIERAQKYGVNLIDGTEFPTYAYKQAGGPIFVENSISGSPNMNYDFFQLQETRGEDDLDESLFEIPNGITKARVYLWIEGQDIDSLETDSDGAEVEISINFTKDTAGWTAFDE